MARFHFCVPLQPREAAGSRWLAADNPGGRSVEARVVDTVRSMLASSGDVAVHVALHEAPPGLREMSDPRLLLHEVPFPPPSRMDAATYSRLSGKTVAVLPPKHRRGIGDKYSKLKECLKHASRDPDCTWTMFVDSDDLVHRDLAKWVSDHGEGWGGHTVTHGYGWGVGDDYWTHISGFHGVCGSCNIVRLTDEEKRQWAAGEMHTFDRRRHWLFAGHVSVFQRLRDSGRPTCKVPFPAVVYVVNTGSNWSGTRRTGRGRVPPRWREFGLG